MIYPINYRACSPARGTVIAVVGMQIGSEGKGAISAHVAGTVEMGVRTGAPNAGHTIYYEGKKYVMRQVPTTWIKPSAQLVIGAGAIISPDILLHEIESLKEFSVARRLLVDYRAHIITPEQIEREQRTDLGARIGSTSALSREGIGVAAADKVLRKAGCLQAKDCSELRPYLADTVDIINTKLESGDYRVLLEGTQGVDLSLDHGEFPYVTSRDTSTAALFASVGLVPHEFTTDIIGVVRSYPIRVAGNSGPFGEGSEEITWQEVARRAGADEDITERTSVTGNVRRVATFSTKGFARACRINRPTCIALTFADYLDWSIHEQERVTPSITEFVETLRNLSGGIPVSFIKTGPRAIIDYEMMRHSNFWKHMNARIA